jgi:hypothetical protein
MVYVNDKWGRKVIQAIPPKFLILIHVKPNKMVVVLSCYIVNAGVLKFDNIHIYIQFYQVHGDVLLHTLDVEQNSNPEVSHVALL